MKAALDSGRYQKFVQIDTPLYFYRTDNATSLTTRLRPSYCDDELKTCQYMMDLFAALPQVPAGDLDRVLLHRLLTVAEGIGYVLTAQDGPTPEETRQKALEWIRCPTMQQLMEQCRRRRLYTPYLRPLLRGDLAGLARLYQLKQQNLRSYQRRYWAGYWMHFARTGRKDLPMF